MKLSRKNKKELRKKIIEKLKEVPRGKRVQLEKELLEELLFEVVTLDKKKGIKVKLPIWSGEFLRKIDLSQVDFTNVSWCILDKYEGSDYQIEFDDITITDESVYDEIDGIRDEKIEENMKSLSDIIVNYAETNANIDLTKSFEAIHDASIAIRACNFTGLDFSHQDLANIQQLCLICSNLSNTRLTIPNETSIQANRSSFDGIDLSSRTINANEYLSEDTYALSYCSLRNTGININLDASVKDIIWNKTLLQYIMKNNWVGCYVNGKKVLSYKEKREKANKKREEYNQMKEDIFNSVLENINEQTNNMNEQTNNMKKNIKKRQIL